jgi:hypothetical protein
MLGRLYGEIGEFNASADYSRKAYELRERTSAPEKYFISAHFYIAVTGNMEWPRKLASIGQRPISGRRCHIDSRRGSFIRSWGW